MLSLKKHMSSLWEELLYWHAELVNQPETAIHEIRKRTKFLRALLAFVPGETSPVKKDLRQLSQILSPFRDATAAIETYERLVQSFPAIENLYLMTKLLEAPALQQRLPDKEARSQMAQSIGRLDTFFNTVEDEPNSSDLHDSLLRAVEKGRLALDAARQNVEPERLHTLRKKTKKLWYQFRFLTQERILPADHPVNQTDRLGKLLGDIHDLDNLMAHPTFKHQSASAEIVHAHRLFLISELVTAAVTFYETQKSTILSSVEINIDRS